MKRSLAALGAILLSLGTPAYAHRLDEYLQATTISVEKDRLEAEILLTPGVAVFSFVQAGIDSNADGIVSESEQRAYATRVLRDLSLTVDGAPLRLHLLSVRFAGTGEMRQGQGEIRIGFDADVPRGGANRQLVFENRHQSRIAAYLVNCLVPRDPDIHVTGQDRNFQQSWYRLNYTQAGARSGPPALGWWPGIAGLLLLARATWLWPSRRRGLTAR